MKKLFASMSLLAFLTIPAQGAFAWTYDGLGSLNPFTNFGRNNTNCGCQKQKLTKCEKLHGMKIRQGQVSGCAAPVEYYYIQEPVVRQQCNNCQRAF